MKAKLLPLYFKERNPRETREFEEQLKSGSREAFSTSPELTTNGMLRKAWRFVEGDGIYLYKGGTEGAANTGNEPYSEYYACQIAGLVLLCWTFGYFGNSVYAWFGKVWEPSEYKGLNATSYLSNDFTEDVAGIKWLKKNVKGSPVVLEANGDSYSGYERVSAMTGLPTVLGWYVHEWLWRDDTADLNEKSADIESIYTSLDAEYVKELLEEYDVSYIFVGSKEWEKYGDALNEEVLNSLGEVVFQDEVYSTYILKVNK